MLGQYKGVCKDDLVGGQDNNQIHTATRENGINTITYRRILISCNKIDLEPCRNPTSRGLLLADAGDINVPPEGPSYVVWAMGRLNENKEPAFHDVYPKANIKVDLNSKEPVSACFAFTTFDEKLEPPWDKGQIYERGVRTFKAYIGPSGGRRGYLGITGKS